MKKCQMKDYPHFSEESSGETAVKSSRLTLPAKGKTLSPTSNSFI